MQNNMSTHLLRSKIEELISKTSFSIDSCDVVDEDGTLWCSIKTSDSKFLIGRDGEALRSFNHLVKKIVDKELGEENSPRIIVDVNGYQRKKMDNLKATAHMLAERARYFKSNIEADPMPSFERRVIHMYLENEKDIMTESKGEGRERRIVIKYVDVKI